MWTTVLVVAAIQLHPWADRLEEAGLLGQEARAVEVTSDGALWVGFPGRGLARVDDGELRLYTSGDGLMSEGIADLLEDGDGRLWAAGLGGYAVFDGSSWSPGARPGGLEPRVVFNLHRERGSGRLWMATSAGAAGLLDSRWRVLTEADGLPHAVVHDVLVDAAGTVWLACRRGLARVRGERVEIHLPELNVRAALAGPDGTLWFGTSDGVRGWDGSGWRRALSGRTVYPALVASDGTVWAGSAASGLFRLTAGEWREVPLPRRLRGAEVFDVAEAPDGALWVATAAGVARLAG